MDPQRTKPIIGLAGGVGSGKSTVARILESLGAAVIDSDRLGHEQLSDPSVMATLKGWWGEAICSTAGVDRVAVAKLVFDDPVELARLERLLYPRIARRREELMDSCRAKPEVLAIVIDAPKLYEAGVDKLCDAVIFVEAERSIRVSRLAKTRGWTEAELTRRENLQESLDRKRANADYIVVNHSGLSDLRLRVEQVFAAVLAACSSSSEAS